MPPELSLRAVQTFLQFFRVGTADICVSFLIQGLQFILGTMIRHHMGDVSFKMYDKFGRVLRIESTCNDISTFRVE